MKNSSQPVHTYHTNHIKSHPFFGDIKERQLIDAYQICKFKINIQRRRYFSLTRYVQLAKYGTFYEYEMKAFKR